MMPANKHMDPIVGVDIHIVLIPSPAGPIPTPLPHPFAGMVMDPMDYVPVVGATVMVNKTPRGNSTTAGMLNTKVHIPMGGPFQMAATIGHDSSNFFGSPRVTAEGSYFSASGFMVMSCNDVGMPLTAAPGKKMKPKPGLYLPSSATIPIPKGPPVMVGGPYVPDLMGALMGLAMSFGMGAAMKAAGKGLKKLNHAVLKKFPATQGLSKKLCKMGFEPVDLITGRMVYEGEDFFMPGAIPITWGRNWYSDSSYQGMMGNGVHCTYDTALHIEEKDQAIVLRLEDGRVTSFPLLIAENDSHYLRQEKLTLTCIDRNTYEVKDHSSDLIHEFSKGTASSFKLSAIKNQDGLANTFLYDAANHLEQIIDTAGRRINITTDQEGRITNIKATHNGDHKDLISYSYNKEGDLIGITDALGKTTHMEYQNHLMVKKTDRNGQSFYWEYDGKETGAKCIKTWGDGGILAGTIAYGKGQNIVTNSLGHETIYYFDNNNLCTQVTDPEGGHIFHEYTEFMEPYRDIDQEGNITGYTHDKRGNLKSIVQPDGAEMMYLYDENNRRISSISPEGVVISKVYKENKLFASVNADGATTSFAYNKLGLISTITDSAGNKTDLVYNSDHNLCEVLVANKTKTTWSYDSWGNCIESTNSEQHIQQFDYDKLGRVSKIILPDNNIVKLKYNAYDEVIKSVDSKKQEVLFDYTPLGKLKLREENGTKVHFKYNTEEQLMAVENERKERYIFGRNKNGQVINDTGFDGLRREYRRDRTNKIVKTLRPGGKFTKHEYNSNGKVTRREHSDGSWETFSYNSDGQLIEAINENSTVKLLRDSSGKVIAEEQDGYKVESVYDDLGNRIGVTSSLGAKIDITRNQLGHVTETTASLDEDTTWKIALKYNSIGQEIERILPGDIQSTFKYDSSGRPIAQKVNRIHKEQRHRTYAWNANDQLRKITNELTRDNVSFAHDSFGKLASAQYEDKQLDYKLPDEVGNLYRNKDQNDRIYGAGGKLLEANGNKYKYDSEGNLKTKISPHGDWEYDWYGNGMLKKVSKPDGKTITFEYDAMGRRTAKIVAPRMSHKDTLITRWVWKGNVPLHEWQYNIKDRPKWQVDDFGDLVKDKPEPLGFENQSLLKDIESQVEIPIPKKGFTTWIFDEGTFKPAAKIVDGEQYSIITDYLGTPVEMYNAQGEKTWEAEYDIYGKIRKMLKGSIEDCPFRYQGQYEDVETGLYYNRFRYYSPEEGMYISQDPIRLNSGQANFYSYVVDINKFVDIFGLDELVYQLINSDGDVVYYGITNRTGLERANEHVGAGKEFSHMEVIADGLSHDDARSLEGALIRDRLADNVSLYKATDSVETKLEKSGLLNKNRGRVQSRWVHVDPIDDVDMLDNPRRVDPTRVCK